MIASKQQKNLFQTPQSGFTIIECLVAVIVVSLLMVAIGPAIAISVATRVQAKRVELATDAAKSYTDGVRAGTVEAPAISATDFSAVAAPTGGSLTCSPPTGVTPVPKAYYCSTSPSTLYCIDNDDTAGCTIDSAKDMIIQAVGYQPNLSAGGTPLTNAQKADKGYRLGIRVYRADAFNEATLDKSTSTPSIHKAKANPWAGGMGVRNAPLIEITTEIVTPNTGYNDFCSRIGCGVASPSPSPSPSSSP